jgi:hypothetical protein
VPAERAREDFMTAEPGTKSDVEYRVAARCEPDRRLLEPQAQRELFRRLADDRAEHAMEMKGRPPRTGGQPIERRTGGPVANLANDLIITGSERAFLTFLAVCPTFDIDFCRL